MTSENNNIASSRAYGRYISTRREIAGDTDERSLREVSDRLSVYLRGWMPSNHSARLLDTGCGNGSALHAFSEWGYTNLEGVDFSEEQVKEAQRCFPQVECGDIFTYLATRQSCYDLITAFDVLEHLSADEAARFMDCCREALRKGGGIIIQTPNAAGWRPGNLMWGDITHRQYYSPPALRQLLYLSGFEDIQFRETRPVLHGVKSSVRAVLWYGLKGWAAICDLIETGKKQEVYTRNMLVFARKQPQADRTASIEQVSTNE